MGSLLMLGCDQGSPELSASQGPPLHVLATYPAAGEGLECGLDAPDSCGVPRDARLEIRFDRYLAPSTAVRQSIKVYTGSEDLGLFTQPEYDVVERVLSYSLPEGTLLGAGVRYTVELLSAESADEFGFRAFDGAPLTETDVPLQFDFRTNNLPEPIPGRVLPRREVSCDQVLGRMAAAGCAGKACHNSFGSPDCPTGHGRDSVGQCISVPRMGLDLRDREGLLATAIGHVAHETETGPKTGTPLTDPDRVGTAMPVVDPFHPDNSYLMYKLIRNPRNYRETLVGCSTAHRVPLPDGVCPEPTPEESARLREWFVRGEPMPLGASSLAINPRAVQEWIRQGARCQ